MCDADCTSPDAEVCATPGTTTHHTDAPSALELSVIDLLRCPELARVDFVVPGVDEGDTHFGPTAVSAAAFRARACEIERRLLHVEYVNPLPVGDASYASVARRHRRATGDTPEVSALNANTLYVREGAHIDLPRTRALVLHETVHATQDAAGLPMDVFHAEVAAYTLQAMVYVLFGSTWSGVVAGARLPIDSTLPAEEAAHAVDQRHVLDLFIAEAETAASELLGAGAGAVMSTTRVASMIASLRRIDLYATRGDNATNFDGITAPTAAVGRHRGRRG